jgi:hypothetical protein
MSFDAWSSSISDLVQAAAIVIGGAWAYLKFIRGRTFRYRARLDIAVQPFTYRKDPVLRIQATMHNEGLSRIDLSLQDEKQVVIHAVLHRQWLPDINVEWEQSGSELIRTSLFQRHTWIESGETIEDELLVPVGAASDEVIAYRVRGIVKAPTGGLRDFIKTTLREGSRRQLQVWTDDLVLPAALTPVGADVAGRDHELLTSKSEELE